MGGQLPSPSLLSESGAPTLRSETLDTRTFRSLSPPSRCAASRPVGPPWGGGSGLAAPGGRRLQEW